jgi:hypothetical protein
MDKTELYCLPEGTFLSYIHKDKTLYGKLHFSIYNLPVFMAISKECIQSWEILNIQKYRLATKDEIMLSMMEN